MNVYKSKRAKNKIRATYDQLLSIWGVTVAERDIETTYGSTHIVECGEDGNPPLVLFHGVGDDSALMWLYNAKALAAHFHIYAVDTIGGPGKSCPNQIYNTDFDQIWWLDDVFNRLGLAHFYIAGVSNGAYIAQHYGIMRPDKVDKILCMSGSAVSAGQTKSPLSRMLKVFLPQALFPTDKNMERLIKKLAGDHYSRFTDNSVIMAHYAHLLKGFNTMAMSRHKIKQFQEEDILKIRDKTLFLIGEEDPLGDIRQTKAIMSRYGLQYRFFPGVGHGINHEISDEINSIMIQYFG